MFKQANDSQYVRVERYRPPLQIWFIHPNVLKLIIANSKTDVQTFVQAIFAWNIILSEKKINFITILLNMERTPLFW